MGVTLVAETGIISVTAPTTSVTVQELVTTIRDWEAELANMTYPRVIDTAGADDLGGGVTTGITMTLSSAWQIQFWSGVTRGTIKDGNVVGGVGGIPVKNTGGSDTILQLGAVATTIATAGGALAQSVWEYDLSGTFSSKTAGWFMKKTTSIVDAILAMVT